MGGEEHAKHASKRHKAGRGPVGKVPVIGLRERGGRTVAKVVSKTDAATIDGIVGEYVKPGTKLHTDGASVYKSAERMGFPRESVCHSAGEYVRGDVHTNGIESVWAVLKRGLHGVYHHASPKHLDRYVQEFAFRLNDGNVNRSTIKRLDSFVAGTLGKRLTYKELTHGKAEEPA